jgi:chromosome segregation ATPase
MELGRCLADSGYLEAVRGLSRLEEEEGVPCTQALDQYQQLLHDMAQKEAELSNLRERLVAQQDKNREAEKQHEQLKKAIEEAKQELRAIQTKRQKEEKELTAFKKRAAREKQDIDEEVEEYRQKANVTKEEAVIAGQVKAQVESYGFSLELVLDLSQEFVGHENAREELARAIQKHGTLTKSNTALIEQGEAQKKALESEQAKVRSLEVTHAQLQGVISQFQADIAHEEELRRFYHRYQSASWLMEYFASWREIYFMRCNNPLLAMTGALDHRAAGARFCVEKPPIRRCPCCGYPDAVYDPRFYQTFNLPLGVPVKLQMGE